MSFSFAHIARTPAVLASFALAACSNGSSGGGTAGASGGVLVPDFGEALALAGRAETDAVRIIGNGTTGGLPGTAFPQIPTTGSGAYAGPAGVSIYEREVTISGGNTTIEDTEVVGLLGTANVTVDFANGSFSGSITDLLAANAGQQTELAEGSLAISNGDFPNDLRPTLMAGEASGEVTAFGTSYDLDYDLTGLLRGTNPGVDNPVKAISLQGQAEPVDGTELLSDIFIVGDKVGNGEGAFLGN